MRWLTALLLFLAGVIPAAAVDLLGARVGDVDLPSLYLRVGLLGMRPVVEVVPPGSKAAHAGLLRGDVIIAVNGVQVKSSGELARAGEVTSLGIYRGIEKVRLKLPLPVTAAPEMAAGPGEPVRETQSTRPVTRKDTPAIPVPVSSQVHGGAETAPVLPYSVVQTEKSTQPPIAEHHSEKAAIPGTVGNAPSGKEVVKSSAVTVQTEQKGLLERNIKPTQDRIIFENSRGRVVFSHSHHLKNLDKAQCLLCHQTEKPTPEAIQSRLDNHRAAHGFCRGCHQKSGRGPATECYACHDQKSPAAR